jgi:hypothetical protein
VIGASLAPRVNTTKLLATLIAFFAAVGLAAHALDELKGRPLRTSIPQSLLVTVSVIGLVVAVGLGVEGVAKVGWVLVPFVVVGPLLVIAYNAEMFGGFIHTDAGFAVAWGAFPVLTAYVAQARDLAVAPVLAAAGAFALSAAQRSLSTPARMIRRKVTKIEGTLVLSDGSSEPLNELLLIAPLEKALRAMSWSVAFLAAALAVSRLT